MQTQSDFDQVYNFFKSYVNIENTYGSATTENKKLSDLIKKTFEKRYQDSSAPSKGEILPLSYWELDKSNIFNALPEPVRKAIHESLCQFVLTGMYFIEKSGFTFCSKLSMLAPTKEEKMAYSIIAHDESRHLNHVARFLPESINDTDFRNNKLLLTLTDTMKRGGYYSSIFIMQVFLEGFGIDLYSKYVRCTSNEDFKIVLKEILADEAFHHGSGKLIFNQLKEFSAEELEILIQNCRSALMSMALGEFIFITKALENTLAEFDLDLFMQDLNMIDQINGRISALEEHSSGTHKETHAKLVEAGVFNKLSEGEFKAILEQF